MNWESIQNDIDRTPVPGGWFVRQWREILRPDGESFDWWAVSIAFYPDPEHTWDPFDEASG